jgi:hypothetical protein
VYNTSRGVVLNREDAAQPPGIKLRSPSRSWRADASDHRGPDPDKGVPGEWLERLAVTQARVVFHASLHRRERKSHYRQINRRLQVDRAPAAEMERPAASAAPHSQVYAMYFIT